MAAIIDGHDKKIFNMNELYNAILSEYNGNTGICDDFYLNENINICEIYRIRAQGQIYGNGQIIKIPTPIKKCFVKFVDSKFPVRKSIKLIYKTYIYDGKKFHQCNKDFDCNRNYIIIYSHKVIFAAYIEYGTELNPIYFIEAEKKYVEEIENDLLTGKISSKHFKLIP
jgi:hypothetical protein